MAGNHPSVVMYSMNHNSLSYFGDCDPDLTDGRHNAIGKIGPRTDRGAVQGLKTRAIVERLDPTRVVYHHSSGTLGNMHTLNLYLNFVPIQERSDWFEHWATAGVKPLLLCEYGVPWDINWTMYRGYYKGKRAYGSARLPWEFCEGEWNSQFLGDRAFQLTEKDKANLRWETSQWRAGQEWFKWDYSFNPSSGYSLQFSPLMEYREGQGLVLICQLDVTGRTEDDPAAARLVANLLRYVGSYTPPPVRTVCYAGLDAGRKHLKQMGLTVAAYQGGTLGADQVLVVGTGGGASLAAHADAVRQWIKGGGNVLGIGLGQLEANVFLPFSIETRRREYISSVFDPPYRSSLLAGVGPADVMNRDPREIELVSGGAMPLGEGVVAVTPDANVVLCQLVPWEFDYQRYFNQKRTFRRVSCLVTRILGNMSVDMPTPLLERFSSPVATILGEKRWRTGFYLDQAEEFDDPYRYFQW